MPPPPVNHERPDRSRDRRDDRRRTRSRSKRGGRDDRRRSRQRNTRRSSRSRNENKETAPPAGVESCSAIRRCDDTTRGGWFE